MRGREFCAGHTETQIGEGGQDQTNPGCSAIDRCNNRLAHTKVVGERRVERRVDTVTWRGDVFRRPGIIAALGRMSLQGLQISARAEGVALGIASDDDHANQWISVRLTQDPAILGVHSPGPGIAPFRPGQGDKGNAVGHCVACGLELHERT